MASLRSQGMVLTLYGDYIRHRGGEIWVGSLIELLKNFGLTEQAIRSALSRMCRKELLSARHVGRMSFFSLTPKGAELLMKGAERIFERRDRQWEGAWHVVVYSIPEEQRETRDRFRQELSWLGFGSLTNGCWLSPWSHAQEVKATARSLGVSQYVEIFDAQHVGLALPRELVARCWDLERIHRLYSDFLRKYRAQLEEDSRLVKEGKTLDPAHCFVRRFMLIHEYRRIPYFDPDLPTELLPKGWLRSQAADLFHEYHSLLAPHANQYFDSLLMTAPEENRSVGARMRQGFAASLVSASAGRKSRVNVTSGGPKTATTPVSQPPQVS